MKSVFTLIFLFTPITFAQNLVPGIWRSTAKFELLGIPLPANEKKECVRTKDVKNLKNAVSEALEKYGCALKQWKLKKQKLEAQLECKTDDLNADGKLSGTIKEKNYELTGTTKGHYKNKIPTNAEFTLTGEWLGPCSEE